MHLLPGLRSAHLRFLHFGSDQLGHLGVAGFRFLPDEVPAHLVRHTIHKDHRLEQEWIATKSVVVVQPKKDREDTDVIDPGLHPAPISY